MIHLSHILDTTQSKKTKKGGFVGDISSGVLIQTSPKDFKNSQPP
jgi:hypothetical protein